MAHIWVDTPGGWAVAELDGDEFVLTGERDAPVRRRRTPDGGPAGTLLLRGDGGRQRPFVLVTGRDGPRTHVNGTPLVLGVRVLADRDALRVGQVRMFFSTETLPHAETYPADAPEVACARCRSPLRPGDPAVRCPSCGVWHHEAEGRRCWTYDSRCANCDQPTALDTGWRWTPEGA